MYFLRYIQINKKNWLLSKCSCSLWCKNYLCKHTIGVCAKQAFFEFSTQAKEIPIGKNRKRGRPKATVSALEYQEENLFSDGDDSNELVVTKNKKSKQVDNESELSDYDLFDDEQSECDKVAKPTSQSTTTTTIIGLFAKKNYKSLKKLVNRN